MFNGKLKPENFDGDDLIGITDRICCLGEVLSFLGWKETLDGDEYFKYWGNALGAIVHDYGALLNSIVTDNYQYFTSALKEGYARAEESRERRENGKELNRTPGFRRPAKGEEHRERDFRAMKAEAEGIGKRDCGTGIKEEAAAAG